MRIKLIEIRISIIELCNKQYRVRIKPVELCIWAIEFGIKLI